MQKLTNEEIVEKLQAKFGDGILKAYVTYDLLNIEVPRELNTEVLEFLKTDAGLGFSFLKDLTGIHFPFNKGEEVGVIYLLHNLQANVQLRLKCFFPAEDTRIRTASTLWPSANWMERETYDFFGIIFEGHPDLRRILNMDELDFFPMLKQYPLEDPTREDKNDKMFGRP